MYYYNYTAENQRLKVSCRLYQIFAQHICIQPTTSIGTMLNASLTVPSSLCSARKDVRM